MTTSATHSASRGTRLPRLRHGSARSSTVGAEETRGCTRPARAAPASAASTRSATRTSGCATAVAALDRVPRRADRVPAEHDAGPHARDVRPDRRTCCSRPASSRASPSPPRGPPRRSACCSPLWLETDHGRVTPGTRSASSSTPTIAAVAVSLVDSRTGYLADLDGIRQVIGDRLLIVDAIQGFGVVDAPYELADVVVIRRPEVGARRLGHRLPRAQRPRARAPHPGVLRLHRHRRGRTVGRRCRRRRSGARAYRVTNPDRSPRPGSPRRSRRSPRSASPTIHAAVADACQPDHRARRRVRDPGRVVAAEHERAGIVVLEPPDRPAHPARRVAAQPRRHGDRCGRARVRLSRARRHHERDARDAARESFVSFATAIAVLSAPRVRAMSSPARRSSTRSVSSVSHPMPADGRSV